MSKFCPVTDFPWYLVCSDGYVINTDTGHVIKGTKKKTGYKEVCLRDENNDPHYFLLHRIVASAFCEKKSVTAEVNHIDGNKDNNCADNLEWVEHGENLRHAYENGLRENDVSPKAVIARNMDTGEEMKFSSIYKAARFLGVSQGNICMCCKGARPYAGGYVWRYEEA